ncbi:hypothetical protein [Streptomyces regalis]|uniref:hypothetical protein n=1 Tax=Streptomyces regalis TaxID=68262 RepID=UPI001FC959C4|nr:hypothetical protein [Streptomyces regalis]
MPSASANYRTLLRTSGAAAFFLPAAVGRLGIAMTGIGIVWLVHARTGSYAAAGLVTGGFAVADAVAGSQIGRLVDRFGQTRVLPCALGAHAGAVALLLVGAVVDLVAGVLVGATLPQLSALSAARWSALLSGERAAALPTAFALEALANGVSYLAGPALVSVLGAAGRPGAGVLLAAARRSPPRPGIWTRTATSIRRGSIIALDQREVRVGAAKVLSNERVQGSLLPRTCSAQPDRLAGENVADGLAVECGTAAIPRAVRGP